MAVRISVVGDNLYADWWHNFVATTNRHTGNREWTINEALVPFSGRDISGTYEIEFDTDEDATAFILKFS